MAENLQNDHFNANQLVMLRSLPSGTVMMGIATEEIQIGDFVTFDYQNTTDRILVRKLTFEEVQLIQNGETTSNNIINRVERIARAQRHANTEEAIEFIIDQHCEYVTEINPTMYPGIPQKPKVHEQDLLYPHECHKCHKKLKYPEAWKEIKQTGMTEEKFQHLWELEEIEFYCCSCYDKATRPQYQGRGRSVFADSIYGLFQATSAVRGAQQRWGHGLAESIIGLPTTHEINPTILYPDALHTLQSVATHRFGPQPFIILEGNDPPPVRSVQQFHVDIHIIGNMDRYIQYRHNIVITTEDHERLRGIGPLDITMTAPMITTEGLARLVAELVFHWISAKILLHPENTLWIPLNDRIDEITPSINFFIERMTHVEGIIGIEAHERFFQTFPNFPHMWNHNNESCDFCGLSPHQVYEWSPRRMTSQIADYRERVLWRGMDIQQHPPAINRVHVYGGIVDGERLEVNVDNPVDQQPNGVNMFIDNFPEITSRDELEALANSRLNHISGAEQNEISYREWLGHYLSEPHNCREHLDADLHCSICRLSMVDIDAERNRNFRINPERSRRFRRP